MSDTVRMKDRGMVERVPYYEEELEKEEEEEDEDEKDEDEVRKRRRKRMGDGPPSDPPVQREDTGTLTNPGFT
ncbi:hypothetical protein M0802_005752 [Mischocyttarus mexicanus]|nr:hypothetical protein M0802_005752 [Mischocyttarus mexicanus]